MRKFFVSILTALCMLCALLGVACATPAPTYKLNVTTLELELFKDYQLIAYKNDEAVAATWTVEGESVTVDESGKLTAETLGDSTVTASVDGKTLTCAVKIIAPATVPLLAFDAAELSLKVGDERTLTPSLTWQGGSEYVPSDITFTSSAPTAIEVTKTTDGKCKVTAKGVAENVEISASCNWHGVILTCKSTADVADNVNVHLSQTAIELYTYATADCDTEQQITVVKVEENGTAVSTPEITWGTENSEVATVENGLITAKLVGTTRVWAEWTNASGKTFTAYVGVTVKLTSIDMTNMAAEELYLNEGDGDAAIALSAYNVGTGLAASEITVYDVTDEANPQTIAATIDASGNVTLDRDDLTTGERVLSIQKENAFGVKLKATVYSLVIDTAAELINWQEHTQLVGEVVESTVKRTFSSTEIVRKIKHWKYTGYVVLGADITLNYDTTTKTGDIVATEEFTCVGNTGNYSYYKDFGFAGTFDGRGYSIIGGLYGAGGLFGGVAAEGVIKNLAIKDAKLCGSTFANGGVNKEGELNMNTTTEWSLNAIIGQTFAGTLQDCLIDCSYFGTYSYAKTAFADNANATHYVQGLVDCTVMYSCGGNMTNVVIFNDRNNNNAFYRYAFCRETVNKGTRSNVFLFTDQAAGWTNGNNHAKLTYSQDALAGVTRGLLTDTVSQTMKDALTASVWSKLTVGANVADVSF